MATTRRVAMCLFLFVVSACAQDVGDIDRTQPNRTKKSDLDGEWFIAQTVTDVPTTQWWTFVGDTSVMERIRWRIEEDVLIAMRSYARIEGSEPTVDDDFDAYRLWVTLNFAYGNLRGAIRDDLFRH